MLFVFFLFLFNLCDMSFMYFTLFLSRIYLLRFVFVLICVGYCYSESLHKTAQQILQWRF